MNQNTHDDYNTIMDKIKPTNEAQTIITWMYNEVGDRVAEELQNFTADEENFEPYDIVEEVIEEIINEFKTSKDYLKLEPIITNSYPLLHDLLKYGYGTPDEIFADYKQAMED